ncbi:DNA-binding response regulator [Bacteroidia bacterium]|nr:DNA-binding response regulator [Bacteroidia bacterium]
MINCIIVDDDSFVRNLIELFISKTESLCLLHSLSNAVEAQGVLHSGKQIDLIFLDIELPEMSGIDFLNSEKNLPQIIIISAKEKYAVNAFDYDITDYLLKPFSFVRFTKAVQKVQDKIEQQLDEEIYIKQNSSLIKIKYADILWIEALENYIIVNTITEKLTFHSTLKAISEKLPDNRFVRIHRSFIVNLQYIDSIEENSVVIKTQHNATLLAIGMNYRELLLDSLNLLKR